MTGATDLRLTPQRRAVLEVLQASSDHPTAQEVYERVRRRAPGIGFATVYRALGRLVDSGQALVLSLDDRASVARYDARTTPHHHLVCDGCGRAVDVDAGVPSALVDRVARRTGFRVSGYHLQLRGHCPDCAAQTSP